MEQTSGLRLGRVYLESEELGVDVSILFQFTSVLRVQLILEGDLKHKLRYEIVGTSPVFDEVGVVGMLEELGVAKTNVGAMFTGCPEYPISRISKERV